MEDEKYLQECEARRKIVANTLGVALTATEGPNKAFLDGEVKPAVREKHRQNREKYRQKRLQDFVKEDPAEKQKRLNFESDARTHTDW